MTTLKSRACSCTFRRGRPRPIMRLRTNFPECRGIFPPTALPSRNRKRRDEMHAASHEVTADVNAVARRFIRFLETEEPPSGLFAPDVFCDFTLPRWRLQARGLDSEWSRSACKSAPGPGLCRAGAATLHHRVSCSKSMNDGTSTERIGIAASCSVRTAAVTPYLRFPSTARGIGTRTG